MTTLIHIVSLTSFIVIWSLCLKSIMKDYCHFTNSNILMLKTISDQATYSNKLSFYAFQLQQNCQGLITSKKGYYRFHSFNLDSIVLENQLKGEL